MLGNRVWATFTGQPMSAASPVKNCKILQEESFTAHKPESEDARVLLGGVIYTMYIQFLGK